MASMQVRLTWCGYKYVPYPPSATQFYCSQGSSCLPATAMEDFSTRKILHVVLGLSTTFRT